MREVEINGVGANAGQQIFADELDLEPHHRRVRRRAATSCWSRRRRGWPSERVVFNTRTGLGTFYTASGLASLGERAAQDKSMFGTLEPDVYFYGRDDRENRARIATGSPRAASPPACSRRRAGRSSAAATTINLEDYAILRNAVMRVKDVPVFYLPIMYYPIQSDDRATGFLLPTYGRSTYRGQSLSNAFFWAINRSQDLTLMHDWFTKTGQGSGAEYRYVGGARRRRLPPRLLAERARGRRSPAAAPSRPPRRGAATRSAAAPRSRCPPGCAHAPGWTTSPT